MLSLKPPRSNASIAAHLLYRLYMHQQGVVRTSVILRGGTPKMLNAAWKVEHMQVFKTDDSYYLVYELPLPFIAEHTTANGSVYTMHTDDPRLRVEYLGANWPTGERALLPFVVVTGFGKESVVHR
jgi:hypothetical protein